MKFSDLASDFVGSQHPLYELRERLEKSGLKIVDLIRANSNEHGLVFPHDLLREIFLEAMDRARVYAPDPFGQSSARKAIADFYGLPKLGMEQILLTPGTSISYWYCFKLLAGADEEILCPLPSYPLLDYIARLSGVKLRYYRLDEARGWAVDFEDLERQIGAKTRAIVLISPHNPTGMVCKPRDIEALVQIAASRDLPIISDEVFSEFIYGSDILPRPAAYAAPLVFTLNGLSKSFALPGLKLGWIAVTGDTALVNKSLDLLETISDSFLPVNEIVQFAAADIFRLGRQFQRSYVGAVDSLRRIALEELQGLSLTPPAGGFYLTLPVDADEDKLAMDLLEREKIMVHPGHFYEMDGNHIVLTFVQQPDLLRVSMSRLTALLSSI